ncbi:MAG: fluoride efflux transporter CrcB [Clostridium sp.]
MGLNIICVGIGGFIGSVLRYLISIKCAKIFSTFIPIGTLFVNVIGGILIGLIIHLSGNYNITDNMKLLLTTGLMGGLTTFSTFSLETINLFTSSNYLLGGVNIVLNVSLSLLGVVMGRYIGGLF